MEMSKPITGFPMYSISVDGTVTNTKTGRLLRPSVPNTCGYLQVALSKDGKRSFKLIHRLIAEHFMDNINDLPVINHINGDKLDNRIDNLEWCTQSHNMEHAYRTGLVAPKSNAKLNRDDANRIRDLIKAGVKNIVIARMFDVSRSIISDIKLGKCWKEAAA